MDDIQDKLGAILGNPQMMQQIMSMAQAFGQSGPTRQDAPPPAPSVTTPAAPAIPGIADAAMLQKIYTLAQQSGIDKNQQALLKALEPYLTRQRIVKLEKAMRAAKITSIATTILGGSGITFPSGR